MWADPAACIVQGDGISGHLELAMAATLKNSSHGDEPPGSVRSEFTDFAC